MRGNSRLFDVVRTTGAPADMNAEKNSLRVRESATIAPRQGGERARSDAQTASTEEVQAALSALSDADLLRLQAAARFHRRLLSKEDAEELVGEAAQRALDGRRTWPKHVPFMAFMLQTMRSIAWERFGRSKTAEVPESRLISKNEEGDDEEGYLDRQPAEDGDPEASLRIREIVDRFESVFADDDEVTAVLIGRLEGLSSEETQREFEMTAKQYAAAQKRLRRAVLGGKLDD